MKAGKNPAIRMIEALENYEVTPLRYLLVFFSISFFRNFLEGLAESSRSIGTSPMFETAFFQMGVLFNLEWFALLSALCLVISLFSSVPVVKVMKIFLASYILISVVPLIDFIFYFPSGCRIDYLYTLHGYLNALSFFFVPFIDAGVCAGIRIEVFAGFALCFAYVFIKSGSVLKAAAASLSLYFLAISSMAFPVFITMPAALVSGGIDAFVSSFFNAPSYGGPLLNRTAVMIFIFLSPLLYALYGSWRGRKSLKTLIFDSFKPAPLLFSAAFAFGFLTAPQRPGLELFSGYFDFALLAAGLLIAVFSGIYHDRTCAPDSEPGVFNALPFLMVASSAAVSGSFFFISLFMLSSSVFMRAQPFKLSSYPVFRALFFALCGLMLYLAGFSTVGGPFSLNSVNIFFPGSAVILFTVFYLMQNTSKNSLLSAALISGFVLAAVSVPRPAILVLSPLLSVISAIIAYMFKPSGRRNALLSFIISAFIIAAAFSFKQ